MLAVMAMATPCHAEEIIAVIHQDNGLADALEINEAPPINDVSVALDEQDANGHQLKYFGECTITYFCPCKRCNGKWGAIDSFGNPLKFGTVAVDTKVIPMHTKLVIDGYDQVFEALDTGSGVKGNHIDVFVPVSHAEALKMGQGERRKVWIWKE
jgi:3D (Asp-Asp-Asp) domain-containing protein